VTRFHFSVAYDDSYLWPACDTTSACDPQCEGLTSGGHTRAPPPPVDIRGSPPPVDIRGLLLACFLVAIRSLLLYCFLMPYASFCPSCQLITDNYMMASELEPARSSQDGFCSLSPGQYGAVFTRNVYQGYLRCCHQCRPQLKTQVTLTLNLFSTTVCGRSYLLCNMTSPEFLPLISHTLNEDYRYLAGISLR